MQVHLVDGTYELFRAFFGAPSASVNGREVGASRGLLRSLAMWLRSGTVTHIAIAFDHVIESFRNDLFAGYKTGEGVEPTLLAQFALAEDCARALGIVTWPMIEVEADDAIGTGAATLARDKRVKQILLVTPDKDLAQAVIGSRIVTCDRHREIILDDAGVVAKFGVSPASIPDYLALVGDAADGIPGIPRWGKTSAAALLARYKHLEKIPDDAAKWDVKVRGADALASSLRERRKDATLYRTLATLKNDCKLPSPATVENVAWRGVDEAKLAAVTTILGIDPKTIKLPRAQ